MSPRVRPGIFLNRRSRLMNAAGDCPTQTRLQTAGSVQIILWRRVEQDMMMNSFTECRVFVSSSTCPLARRCEHSRGLTRTSARQFY